MAMEIVTGSTGKAHVTPIDDAVRNTNCGHYNDCVVFDVLDQLDAEITTNNLVTVKSGYGMIQGRYFKIMRGETGLAQIDVTRPDTKRMDIISARYTFNPQSTYEDISLVVLKGTPGNDYEAPETISSETHNVNEGDNQVDFPLYKVYVDATNGSSKIDHIEKLFTPLPDGGRLGEIEAAFQNVLTEFEEVQETVNNLPSDISQAASKQYVDSAVGQMGASKSGFFHKYAASSNPSLSQMGGNSTNYGHVKLLDDYSGSEYSTNIAAANSVGASLKAVQDAYNDLKQSFMGGCNAIATALQAQGITPPRPTAIGSSVQYPSPNDYIAAIDQLLAKRTRTIPYSVVVSPNSNSGTSYTVKTTINGVVTQYASVNGEKTWTQNI